MNLRNTMFSDSAARKVCTPYQAIAMSPRMIAGMFAPRMPKTTRLMTGKGTPVFWLGLATMLAKTCTMTMPAISATSTCHDCRPRAKSEPAVT